MSGKYLVAKALIDLSFVAIAAVQITNGRDPTTTLLLWIGASLAMIKRRGLWQ